VDAPDEAARIGAKLRSTRERFGWNAITDRVWEVYERPLAAKEAN
jgi:hypothetical protein